MKRIPRVGFAVLTTLLAGLTPAPVSAQTKAYNPIELSDVFSPETLDLSVTDTQRQRDIPVLVYLPQKTSPAPVVFFSHGLGGSRQGNAFMGQHWSARGYVAVFVQHPGSDTSVWQSKRLRDRMKAMTQAASAQNFLLRVGDIPAVLDQLKRWHATEGHALNGRLDLDRVGMSGHSFGAVTTQAVSGQTTPRGRALYTDGRILAAIAFSPSGPRLGTARQAFGAVKTPWLLMTGTKDLSPIGNADLASRLSVFPALPPGDKYELVLKNAEHSAFTDRALPGDTEPRNPNHHRVILALSTAFWDAYLRDNAEAKTWLTGPTPKALMEKEDRWQTK